MTGQEIELRKKQIEIQLAEYEHAISDAVTWHQQWKQRQQQRGFRCVRRNESPEFVRTA